DRAHRAAGDDAGAGLGGANDDLAGTVAIGDVMVKRAALAQRHADQAAPRLLGRLADRLGYFARLPGAIADAALAVADNDECGKAKAPAAFHHLGDTVDADQLFSEFAFAIALARLAIALAATPAIAAALAALASGTARRSALGACHQEPLLEIETALAGGV